MLNWGRHREWSFAPFTVLDVGNPSSWDALLPIFVEVMADRVACVAFPAEAAAEMHVKKDSTLDDPGNDTMQVPLDEDLSKAVDREKDLLDAMLLCGTPVDEAERRRSWETEKLISGQTETTGISLIKFQDLRWVSTSLLHSRAYQYSTAKVCVLSDSVLLGEKRETTLEEANSMVFGQRLFQRIESN